MTPTPEQLMMLHDGELADDEAEALEAELGDSAHGQLEGLEQLGEFLRAHTDRADPGPDLTEAVMARLDERPQLRAVDGGGAVDLTESGPAARQARTAAVVGVLAVAAAAVLVTRAGMPEPEARGAVAFEPKEPTATATAEIPAPTAAEEAYSAAAIEVIDFGGNNGSIFMVSAESGTTPVVWVTEPPKPPRMEPL